MPRLTLLLPEKNAQPYKLPLERELTRIGRDAANDIVIDSSSVSSYHCEMKRVLGGFILQDLGSTNGLKVDDSLRKMVELHDGSVVKIGDATVEFSFSEEELATLKEESLPTAPADESAELPAIEVQNAPSLASPGPDTAQEFESEPSNSSNALVYLILVLLALAVGVGIRYYQDVASAKAEIPAVTAPAQSAVDE